MPRPNGPQFQNKGFAPPLCHDCGTNLRRRVWTDEVGDDHLEMGEYYHVHDPVWKAAGMKPDQGELCVGCLEDRLGRKLHFTDFSDAPINFMQASDRLSDRRQIWSGHTRNLGPSKTNERGWHFPYGNFGDEEPVSPEQVENQERVRKEMGDVQPRLDARKQWVEEQMRKSVEKP